MYIINTIIAIVFWLWIFDKIGAFKAAMIIPIAIWMYLLKDGGWKVFFDFTYGFEATLFFWAALLGSFIVPVLCAILPPETIQALNYIIVGFLHGKSGDKDLK